MKSTIMRPQLKGELLERVQEHVLNWVQQHTGRRVPATNIARKYGIAGSQVSYATRRLADVGKILLMSRFTYEIPKPITGDTRPPVRPNVEPTLTITKDDFSERVIALAKDFNWQTSSNNLREFVEWLGSAKR